MIPCSPLGILVILIPFKILIWRNNHSPPLIKSPTCQNNNLEPSGSCTRLCQPSRTHNFPDCPNSRISASRGFESPFSAVRHMIFAFRQNHGILVFGQNPSYDPMLSTRNSVIPTPSTFMARRNNHSPLAHKNGHMSES